MGLRASTREGSGVLQFSVVGQGVAWWLSWHMIRTSFTSAYPLCRYVYHAVAGIYSMAVLGHQTLAIFVSVVLCVITVLLLMSH